MPIVTLKPKFQVVIPLSVRKRLNPVDGESLPPLTIAVRAQWYRGHLADSNWLGNYLIASSSTDLTFLA
jgi:hypothetical protein